MKKAFILLMSLVAIMTANLNVMAQETATAKASMGDGVNRSQHSFITNGNWNDGSHWDTGIVPPSGSDVVIMADAIIPAGYTAVVNEVSIEGGSITVSDGGQLRHNTEGLVVTMKKNIEPYEDVNGTDNYYLLAFPFSVDVAVPNAMTAIEGNDFYKFDGDYLEAEWRNNKQETIATVSGTTGYLYANSEAIELSLTGSTYPSYNEEVISVTVPYDEGSTNSYNGWALLGNPFTCNAYIYCHNSNNELVPMDFMVYDATGELMTLSGEPIAPMQGFFVKVTETTTVYIMNYADHSFHEYIDLGLPSGLLWATCNVGADSPEDYGDYFSWGETQPKDTYNWSTYQYSNGSYNTLTKYCTNSSYGYNGFTDNLTTLLPEDDAATANWGGDWRMPTKEEWQELYNNTTCTWTTQNGVNGSLFTASNGNILFLPGAGSRFESSPNGAGSYGSYWSSSLIEGYPGYAWYFDFDSDYYYVGNDDRNRGQSVRAVRSSGQSTSFIINATDNPEEGGEVSGGGTYLEGTECTLTATPNESYTFTNWTENGEVVSTEATFSFPVNGNRNFVANFAVSGGSGDDHSYVDLGLPSGTLWATCNVGADAPEEYGDYFAWGETQPKDIYNWNSYLYCNGSENSLTKYCDNPDYGYNGYTDTLTILLPEDDAATANWGIDWRMPTREEWAELYYNTTCTWTTQNGICGRLFTASNGNSIFMPTAGYRRNGELYYIGSRGYYWTSSRISGGAEAWLFYFDSGLCSQWTYAGRNVGRSVRAVRTAFIININAMAYPMEGGVINGGGAYQEGAECTLIATANEGFIFTNWTENGVVVSTEAAYSFTVTNNRTLVANFTIQNYTITVSANPSDGGSVSGSGNYNYGQICTVAAITNSGYYFVNWTEDGNVVSTQANFTFTVNSNRTLVANFIYHSVEGHAYVDLGLPSGTLWATCNVGADTPKDYGDYFAWGEIQPKDNYLWSTYQYSNGGFYNSWGVFFPYFTKYCTNSSYGYDGFTDNLTILQSGDDAATANWGSDWRMPTKEELEELYNNTTFTWVTQNGVNGRLFTAANGNSLFMPAAGYRREDQLKDAGRCGSYWLSLLNTDEPFFAWGFSFGEGGYGANCYSYRDEGNSVRPVRSTQPATNDYTITITPSPTEGGGVWGGGTYQQGQSCTVLAMANTDYCFTNWTENGDVVSTNANYTFTVTGNRSLVANFTYNSDTFVDLGLPSGLLWATCNIGAAAPEEYGDYFAWGETQPKDTYNWSTYQYCMGSNTTLTKYCYNSSYGYNGFTDNLTTLLPEDDAGTANWGSDWRMPTQAEWQELLDNTTVTWTQQNGVNGRLFTASNGNSLFLPAAGCRYDSSLYDAGSSGYYWSSSLSTVYPSCARILDFDSGYYTMDYIYHRSHGQSVRAVRSSGQN